jgi:hypothetical protein
MAIQIGEFFFDPAFMFADGVVGEKLFIVLARSKADNFIVARTTSNPQRKSFHYGCHNDEPDPNFCVPKTAGSPFNEHTWVNLDYLSEFDSYELTNRVEKLHNIQRLGSIPTDILKAIMDCAARADDTLRYQSDAIRNTLAALP